ncbi:hypothetical protein KFL_002350130 [Klebsormidium nitens]|uniref:RRM domain-containing protein n=1 Tax=Klebsormidium nitens TaxID=105231 RepID=A0A1Y1IBH5_KLENI|nr:hypothetical protein KFL_002350130 [Klebsormidium nitens]|eukprot:GAQ85438.1 hypothetical protein KFL_002350130 [Klebsormidium nitens]
MGTLAERPSGPSKHSASEDEKLPTENASEVCGQESDTQMGGVRKPAATGEPNPESLKIPALGRETEGALELEGVNARRNGEVSDRDTAEISGEFMNRVDGDTATANIVSEEGTKERGQDGGTSCESDMHEAGVIDRERNESNRGEVSRRDDPATNTRRERNNRSVRGGAESSDWRRGKRERSGAERDPRSSSPAEDDERGRKRRKSGDLPLSPAETKFRMGAREGRGSPRFEPDRRRARYQPPRTPSEEDQRATLYVGDIEAHTSKWDLRRTFERFGDVKEAKMITGQCYGFVTFRSRPDAETALQSADSIDILGRKPYMSLAQGAMPAWKIGVGGFVVDPQAGIIDKRDALSKAAEVAAATAAAVLAKQKTEAERQGRGPAGGRSIVAYDDLF